MGVSDCIKAVMQPLMAAHNEALICPGLTYFRLLAYTCVMQIWAKDLEDIVVSAGVLAMFVRTANKV